MGRAGSLYKVKWRPRPRKDRIACCSPRTELGCQNRVGRSRYKQHRPQSLGARERLDDVFPQVFPEFFDQCRKCTLLAALELLSMGIVVLSST